jgi:hypothetical protein
VFFPLKGCSFGFLALVPIRFSKPIKRKDINKEYLIDKIADHFLTNPLVDKFSNFLLSFQNHRSVEKLKAKAKTYVIKKNKNKSIRFYVILE